MFKDTPQDQTRYCPMCEDSGKRIAELEQRVKVLTDAINTIQSYIDPLSVEWNVAEKALNQTPQQTAEQIERGHIEWMMKQVPFAWLWRMADDEDDEADNEWHLSVGPYCPTYRDECVTVPLVAIPPLPKESKE